jgi:hypothetical protein
VRSQQTVYPEPMNCGGRLMWRAWLGLRCAMIIFVTTTMVGCSDQVQQAGLAAKITRTDGGKAIIRNPPQGAWSSGQEWTIEETLRIGSVGGDSEELFGGNLHSVRATPGGDIFAVDFQSEDVRVFDRDGEFLRRFGGPGQGPGELAAPGAIGFDARGYLWIATLFNGRYSVFNSSGVLEKTVQRPVHGAARFQHALVFDEPGSFIDEDGEGMSVILMRVDTAGVVLDSFPVLRHPERPPELLSLPVRRGSEFRKALDYLPRLVWTVANDGTVWFTRSDTLRLIQRSLGGDTLKIIETSHRSSALRPEDETVIRQGLVEVGKRHLFDLFGRQVIQAIRVLADGHVLVQIGVESDAIGGSQFDVFDPEGVFLGTVDTDLALSGRGIPGILGDTIYSMAFGTFDVPYVVRAEIIRPPVSR